MDGHEEKKWFVFMGDHHEGPFSLVDIQGKMSEGAVTPVNFVWCDGMQDWKVMSDVPEFEPLTTKPEPPSSMELGELEPPGPSLTIEPAPAIEPTVFSPSITVEAVPTENASLANEPMSALLPASNDVAPVITAVATESAASVMEMPSLAAAEDEKTGEIDEKTMTALKAASAKRSGGFMGISRGTIRLAVAILIFGLGGIGLAQGYFSGFFKPAAYQARLQEMARPALLWLVDKVPALASVISPIPTLDDVLPDDYEDLKAAASVKVEEGPRIAVALSRDDLTTPSFYVTSNLPDGALVDIYISGISDTLLNQTAFETKVQATLSKRIARSTPVRLDGRPVARGEYMVYAVENENQPPAVKMILNTMQPTSARIPENIPKGVKLLAAKRYFLGGSKDAVYSARLKEYHDKLKDKATTELAEVKQFMGTLESQLTTSTDKFTKLRHGKKITPAQRKQWTKFHDDWMALDTQLGETFHKWTQGSPQSEYFYGMIYQQIPQVGQAVEQVHILQHGYFTGAVTNPKSFDIQLAETLSSAQAAIGALKALIDKEERIPPTPNGMPRKE